MTEPKRPRGRPRAEKRAKFKTMSIPEELWNECNRIAIAHGTTVGKVGINRMRNGHYDPVQDEEKIETDAGVEF